MTGLDNSIDRQSGLLLTTYGSNQTNDGRIHRREGYGAGWKKNQRGGRHAGIEMMFNAKVTIENGDRINGRKI